MPVGTRNAAEIEPALREFAKELNGGLIVAPSPFNTTNQELIFALAAELRLPAIYPFRYFPEHGGLASYGFDTVENIAAPPPMSSASSKVRNRATCPCKRRPSTGW